MRDQYHEELNAISDALVRMTELVATAVEDATRALLDGELETAEAVISGDRRIDDVYADIEQRAFDVMARQQPVASDLRMLITSLRMVADLERMGDYAAHVAQLARLRYPSHAVPDELRDTVREMGAVAGRIARKCGLIIARRDATIAAELEHDDDAMDDLFRRLFTVLLAPEWRGGVEGAVDVVLCGRYYERFCDHAVSVARRILYLVTGERPVRLTRA